MAVEHIAVGDKLRVHMGAKVPVDGTGREGRSAVMAWRRVSSRMHQVAISLRVRPQPMQCPVWPLTAQNLMQGLEIGCGSMGIELTRPPRGDQP